MRVKCETRKKERLPNDQQEMGLGMMTSKAPSSSSSHLDNELSCFNTANNYYEEACNGEKTDHLFVQFFNQNKIKHESGKINLTLHEMLNEN